MNTIYVYGTLRTGNKDADLVQIPAVMYDLGWYPGIELKSPESGCFITAERLEVTDSKLVSLDSYEGYNPDNEPGSLYLRRPYLDGWIYVYNHSFEGRTRIKSGDWLNYINHEKSDSPDGEGCSKTEIEEAA